MQTQFVQVLRPSEIEIVCNVIVTAEVGALTPRSVPCEVHKQEEGWVSFLSESGEVADSRHYRFIKHQ